MFLTTSTRQYWRSIVYAVLVIIFTYLVSSIPTGRTVENMCYDLFTRITPAPPPSRELVIVAIDEPSFQEIGLPWPWPRTLHARLVSRLSELGAKSIIFDVVFAEPTETTADTLFAKEIEKAGNVVLAASVDRVESDTFLRQILISPFPLLSDKAAGVGLAMIRPDEDGVVRRFSTIFDGLPSLPQAALQFTYPQQAETLPEGFIRFTGPGMTIPHVSFYQILSVEHPHPRDQIQGKIVLVGQSLSISPNPASVADTFRTPFSTRQSPSMSGVEIQASILQTLLTGMYTNEVVPLVYYCFVAVVLVLLSVCLFQRKPLPTVLLGCGACVTWLVASGFIFTIFDIWFPPVIPAIACLMLCGANLTDGYVVVSRQRVWIKNAFSRYISPEVVSIITAHPERLKLGGEEVDATVMFLDLAGFTTLSEKLAPTEVILLLSEIFAPMTDIIKQEHGTLDKFIGDAIMAFWGAPIPQHDHAVRACGAALAMQARLREINHYFEKQGSPTIHARIGLHSGALVVGNVGSRDHFNYTCLGDTVNLASRLESANKIYGTSILLSNETASRLDDTFILRQLDQLRVKGRTEATTVFELLGAHPLQRPLWLVQFEEARKYYIARDFGSAAAMLEDILDLQPDDRPSKVLLQRCLQFQKIPPPSDWDGVWPAAESPSTG